MNRVLEAKKPAHDHASASAHVAPSASSGKHIAQKIADLSFRTGHSKRGRSLLSMTYRSLPGTLFIASILVTLIAELLPTAPTELGPAKRLLGQCHQADRKRISVALPS
jgi:hypothetical protein